MQPVSFPGTAGFSHHFSRSDVISSLVCLRDTTALKPDSFTCRAGFSLHWFSRFHQLRSQARCLVFSGFVFVIKLSMSTRKLRPRTNKKDYCKMASGVVSDEEEFGDDFNKN